MINLIVILLLAFTPGHPITRHSLMVQGHCTRLARGEDYFGHPGEKSLLMRDNATGQYGLYGVAWIAMEDFQTKRVIAWCTAPATRPGV